MEEEQVVAELEGDARSEEKDDCSETGGLSTSKDDSGGVEIGRFFRCAPSQNGSYAYILYVYVDWPVWGAT